MSKQKGDLSQNCEMPGNIAHRIEISQRIMEKIKTGGKVALFVGITALSIKLLVNKFKPKPENISKK